MTKSTYSHVLIIPFTLYLIALFTQSWASIKGEATDVNIGLFTSCQGISTEVQNLLGGDTSKNTKLCSVNNYDTILKDANTGHDLKICLGLQLAAIGLFVIGEIIQNKFVTVLAFFAGIATLVLFVTKVIPGLPAKDEKDTEPKNFAKIVGYSYWINVAAVALSLFALL